MTTTPTKNTDEQVSPESESSALDEMVSGDPQADRTADPSEPRTPQSILSPAKLSEGLATTVSLVTTGVKKFGAMIKGDFSAVLSPYAAYTLRVLGGLIVFLAFVNPVFNLGGEGVFAWLQTVVLNIVVAFGLFVVAEVVLIQRDIANTLQAIAAQQPKENEDDG